MSGARKLQYIFDLITSEKIKEPPPVIENFSIPPFRRNKSLETIIYYDGPKQCSYCKNDTTTIYRLTEYKCDYRVCKKCVEIIEEIESTKYHKLNKSNRSNINSK